MSHHWSTRHIRAGHRTAAAPNDEPICRRSRSERHGDVGDDQDFEAEEDGAADSSSCGFVRLARFCSRQSFAARARAATDPTASTTTPAISNALTTFSIHSSKCIVVQSADRSESVTGPEGLEPAPTSRGDRSRDDSGLGYR